MDWVGLISLLAAGYALFVAVCAWHIVRRLRRPPRRTYAWALAKGLPGDPGEVQPRRSFESPEVVWRDAASGAAAREVVIPVWVVPGDAADGPVIVLTPGWGDSRVGGLVRLTALAPLASRVILWDPPGLGASEVRGAGKKRAPRWSMSTRDHEALAAVLDACVEDASREARVVLFGWSAGAGSSIVAAAESNHRDTEAQRGTFVGEHAGAVGMPTPLPATRGASPPSPARGEGDLEIRRTRAERGRGWRVVGVVAEAPYRLPWTPGRNVLRGAGLPWFLCGPLAFAALGLRVGVGPRWRGFDRAEHAARLKGRAPLLVLHGVDDEVCPVQDGREIARAADGPIVEIEGGRHNDLWVEPAHREACERAVAAFITKLR